MIKDSDTQTANIRELFGTVVEGGYCIGCGACAAVKGSPIKVRLDKYGCYQATLGVGEGEGPGRGGAEDRSEGGKVTSVCPFSDDAMDEDALGAQLFPNAPSKDAHLGRYYSTYAGYVSEPGFRERGGSGGIAKWLLVQLLRKGMVDHVVQVTPNTGGEAPLFGFEVFSTPEDVLKGATSAYYPVEMSGVLAKVREMEGSFAFIGIPCFIKSLRLLTREDEEFRRKIRYCVGLVCGHLKSTRYADMIAWQKGIEPGQLRGINFRKKGEDLPADHKVVEVRGIRNGDEVTLREVEQDLFGASYNDGLFKYKACDYCDDVVAETADISVGDAWLPEYIKDWQGTSIVVVRHPELQVLVDEACSAQLLFLEALDPERVAKSQEGGFRDRREGLSYRLHLAGRARLWHPRKRVPRTKDHIGHSRRKIYEMRTALSSNSHRLFRTAEQRRTYSLFETEMTELLTKYRQCYHKNARHHVPFHTRARVLVGRLTRFAGLHGLMRAIGKREK